MDTKQNIRPEIMEGIRKHIAPLVQLEKADK